MKKILICILALLLICGCSNETESKKFKKDYESLNGKSSSYGEYRTLNIDENSFVFSSSDEIIKMIENNESFYVYFGDKACPWCRSVIEKAITISKKYSVSKIYYINIWDDNHNEILRDKYELKDGVPVKVSDGDKNYQKLLEYFNDYLKDYTLTDEENNIINVGEKRIFAPTFIYVENGKAIRETTGISEKLTSPFDELTEEILKDEEKLFNDFFGADLACSDKC